MSFKKYGSIENHYRQKYIMKAIGEFPELQDQQYIIQEKIDGANLQLYFEPNKPMRVGKRSGFIKEDENFFDYQEVLKKYDFSKVQATCDKNGDSFRIYGELFGKGIQKRVNYGKHKYFRIFDIEMNGQMVTINNMHKLINEFELFITIPELTIVDSLVEALEFDVNFDSYFLGVEDNPAEGIVIKPLTKEYTLHNGKRFIIKKKSDRFKEKENNDKAPKKTREVESEVVKWNIEFRRYINQNRVDGIFSKHGPLEDMKDFGKYISLVLDDAKEDFLKDNELPELDKKDIKYIYNVGSTIALLLKGSM